MQQERLVPVAIERLGISGSEPVTLSEAKAHLRVVDDGEDAHIEALISAAREACEDMARRSFALQEWRATFSIADAGGYMMTDDALAKLRLPRPPFVGGVVVSYALADGTMEEYSGAVRIGRDSAGALLDWALPGDLDPTAPCPVSVSYQSGYATIPHSVRQAILLMVSNLYENRTPVGEKSMNEAPLSVRHLLKPYTVPNA